MTRKYKIVTITTTSVVLLTIIGILSWLFYPLYVALWNSIVSFFESIGFYFLNIFHVEDAVIPLTSYDHIIGGSYNLFENFNGLPKLMEVFASNVETAFYMAFTLNYFYSSTSFIVFILENFSLFITLVGLIVALFYVLSSMYFVEKDEDLQGFSRNYYTVNKVLLKISRFTEKVKSTLLYIFSKKYFKYPIILFSLLFIGALNVIIDTITYILIFVSSFDINYLYYRLFTSFYFLFPFITSVPLVIWIIVILIIIDRIRLKLGIRRMLIYNEMDKEFVDDLGVATLVTGPPGSGKTTLLVDMALASDENFKVKLLSIMNKYRHYFPKYNFTALEKFIEKHKQNSSFKNRLQFERYIEDVKIVFYELLTDYKLDLDSIEILFNYDVFNEPITYYNELQNYNIFDVIKIYGMCYFIYIREESSLVGTQSIRLDSLKYNDAYFPLFDFNFFARKEESFDIEHYSHVLKYDSLRLGKRMDDTPPVLDCVNVIIPEIDKDGGNQFDQKKSNYKDELANINNDDFNLYIKISRHFNTIDNYPFFKLFADLQRLGSLNLDMVEISENVLEISGKSKEKNVLRTWIISKYFGFYILDKLDGFIKNYKSTRNYISGFYLLISKLSTSIYTFLTNRINLFSYKVVTVNKSHGSSEEKNECKYYLLNKKIYSMRFATDFYKNLLAQEYLDAQSSYEEERKFLNVYPTVDELKYQNSYLVDKLLNSSVVNRKNKEKMEDELHEFL